MHKFIGRAGLLGGALTCAVAAAELPPEADLTVPELGTSGGAGLTVAHERQLGEFFARRARGAALADPVINEYLDGLAQQLLLHAEQVRFPFEFLLIDDPHLNAGAFLGGKVLVNTGLFHYAVTEAEFASVLAHEIAHVTQRHIARAVEDRRQNSAMSLAAVAGSIAVGLLVPAVGAAALSGTTGLVMQHGINFTRRHEAEADRVGIATLYKAGFDPAGAVSMFRRLLKMQGNLNPAFTLLVDHPLSEERIADARNRLARFPARKYRDAPEYQLARARVEVRYFNRDPAEFKARLLHADTVSPAYREYGLALLCYALREYAEARTHLAALPQLRDNFFIVDLQTDLDLADGHAETAISRLRRLSAAHPDNRTLTANLAAALLEAGRAPEAVTLLNGYLNRHPQQLLFLELLTQAQDRARQRCDALQTRAAAERLQGGFERAAHLYREALNVCHGAHDDAILQAQIARVREEQRADAAMEGEMNP